MHRRRDARVVRDRVERRPAGRRASATRSGSARRSRRPTCSERSTRTSPTPAPTRSQVDAPLSDPARADGAGDRHGGRGDDPVVVGDRVLQVVGREQVERRGGHGDEEPARRQQAEPARREDEHRQDADVLRRQRPVDRAQRVEHAVADDVRERVAPVTGEARPELLLGGVPERRQDDVHGDERPGRTGAATIAPRRRRPDQRTTSPSAA